MASTTLWAVHIQGPDDIVPTADYLSAVRCANAFNAWWTNFKTEKPLDDYDPRMWASPIEWTGDAERHAEWVQNPSPDYAYFLRLSAQQREPATSTAPVKRYCVHYDARGEYEHPNGDFVHWSDYQALIQRESVVKQLDWVERERGGGWSAKTGFGTAYSIIKLANGFHVAFDFAAIAKGIDTLDEAKSAAQADYEQRIMAAVEIQSSDGGIMDAARKAKARVDTWSDAKKDFAERAMLPSDPASGRSQPSPDVSVDELARLIADAIGTCVDDDKSGVWINCHPAARALLARYRIERLDRLAKSGRR